MPPQKHLRRFVISGPIGSGKSAVGALLAARGALVIEADRMGHAVLEPDGEAFAEVAWTWPDAVSDGRIDRRALAAIVFADPKELARLEAISHPHIARRIATAASRAGDRVVAVELPLTVDLLGDAWHRLVVLAPADVRFDRAVARGMDPSDVQRRMAVQARAEVWRELADSVIVNDGDLADLGRCVDDWWSRHVGI